MKLVQHLLDRGYEEMVERVEGKRSYRFPKKFINAEAMRQQNQEDIKEDRRFLEMVLEATGGDGGAVLGTLDPSEAQAVSALVRVLDLGGFPVGTWELMVYDNDTDAVQAVFEGGVGVTGIEIEQLVREAAGVIKYLDQIDPGRQIYFGLLGTLPKVPVDPHWHRAAETGLAAEALVRALRHPSEGVAINAAKLIAHGGGAPEAKSLITGALEGAPEHTYRAVAYLDGYIWGEEEALENLLAALRDGVTPENYWLLLALADLPLAKDDSRATEALLSGLQSENPDVATTLADKMNKAEGSEFPLFEALTPQLDEVLEHWTKRGTTCETHGGTIYGDRCPKCNTVPGSPRAALVRQLGQAGSLELGYLIELCNDPRDDVRRAAVKLAAAKAVTENAIPNLLERVDSGDLPLLVLQEIVALPAQPLRPVKDALVALLNSASAEIKEVTMSALARGGWIDLGEAKGLALSALDDDDLGVRDRAVETLKTLAGHQE